MIFAHPVYPPLRMVPDSLRAFFGARHQLVAFAQKAAQATVDETGLVLCGVAPLGGFNSLVNIWELSTRADGAGDQPTGKEFASYVKATDGDHMFGSTPLSCSTAPPPYVAVCNSVVSIAKWDGTSLVPVKPNFSAADLIAGTELKPGP
jgi:hypothetical protein